MSLLVCTSHPSVEGYRIGVRLARLQAGRVVRSWGRSRSAVAIDPLLIFVRGESRISPAARRPGEAVVTKRSLNALEDAAPETTWLGRAR